MFVDEFRVNQENSAYTSDNGILYDKNMTTLINYPAGKADSVYEIPETVTTILTGAIEVTNTLEKIVICLIQKRKTLSCILAVTHSFTVAPVMWVIVKINPDLIWHSFWIGDALAVVIGVILYKIYKVKLIDERLYEQSI